MPLPTCNAFAVTSSSSVGRLLQVDLTPRGVAWARALALIATAMAAVFAATAALQWPSVVGDLSVAGAVVSVGVAVNCAIHLRRVREPLVGASPRA